MILSEQWLASEQRHSMSYERWLEYAVADAELDAQRYRKLSAFLERNDLCDMPWPTTFDAAVDALPEPK